MAVTETPAEMQAEAVNGQDKRPGSRTAAAAEPPVAAEPHITSTDDVVPTTKFQFLIILVALILAIFCVALDNTIIVTAIPRITDDYKTLSDVGWRVKFSHIRTSSNKLFCLGMALPLTFPPLLLSLFSARSMHCFQLSSLSWRLCSFSKSVL